MKKQIREDGVSPVVGVMLMLVVTIIIAAMVASFTGGLAGEQKATPQVKLDVSYTASIIDTDKTNTEPDYKAGYKPNNGLTFRLLGGDSFRLKDIAVQLKSGDATITFDLNVYRDITSSNADSDKLNIIRGSNGVNETYFAVAKQQDEVIALGETFSLLADGYYDNSLNTTATKKGQFLRWTPVNGGTFDIQLNVPVEYVVLDKNSGGRMQAGTITIR
ncbi:MAG: type IV pilin N-terminal domain-containing protein [Methanocorpusculum sp.]|nr:type IV pilin N-terminal domain-containing protein [Methanocorpusculum sp.]